MNIFKRLYRFFKVIDDDTINKNSIDDELAKEGITFQNTLIPFTIDDKKNDGINFNDNLSLETFICHIFRVKFEVVKTLSNFQYVDTLSINETVEYFNKLAIKDIFTTMPGCYCYYIDELHPYNLEIKKQLISNKIKCENCLSINEIKRPTLLDNNYIYVKFFKNLPKDTNAFIIFITKYYPNSKYMISLINNKIKYHEEQYQLLDDEICYADVKTVLYENKNLSDIREQKKEHQNKILRFKKFLNIIKHLK